MCRPVSTYHFFRFSLSAPPRLCGHPFDREIRLGQMVVSRSQTYLPA